MGERKRFEIETKIDPADYMDVDGLDERRRQVEQTTHHAPLAARDLEPFRPAGEYLTDMIIGNRDRWEQMYADIFDRAAGFAPDEAPAFGIVSAVPPQPATEPDPRPLIEKLREVFERVSKAPYAQDPPPIVSPEMARRHNEAQNLPRAPYTVVRWRGRLLSEWLKPEPPCTPAPGVDPWGSLWGRRLFRTGEYLARPAEGGGFDIAEIMDTP